jgi:hypothetical protein
VSELENLPLKEDKIKLGFETETVTLRLPEKSQNDIMNKNVMIGHDPNKNVMYRLYGTQKIPETYIISSSGTQRAHIPGALHDASDITQFLKNN